MAYKEAEIACVRGAEIQSRSLVRRGFFWCEAMKLWARQDAGLLPLGTGPIIHGGCSWTLLWT